MNFAQLSSLLFPIPQDFISTIVDATSLLIYFRFASWLLL